MATVFEEKDSVFFVGGIATKVGDAYAGGCTLEAWNNPAKLNKLLTNVMEADGTPLSADNAWNGLGTACEVFNAAGTVRIVKVNAFTNVKLGNVVNVEFDAVYISGRYEVIGWTDADEIIIDLAYTLDDLCDAKVGGAFDTAQNAWLNTDAQSGYNVTIYSNKDQSKTAGDFTATWALGLFGGSYAGRTFKRFVGFTTQPEDGGQVTFDGEDDAAFSPNGGIRFEAGSPGIQNVIFENVIVEDAYRNWNITSAYTNNIRFINCEGNSGGDVGWKLGSGKCSAFIDCKAKDNTNHGFDASKVSTYVNNIFINCIASNNGKRGFYLGAQAGAKAIGCLSYSNGWDGFLTDSDLGNVALINCVAYDNGHKGFHLAESNPIVINCIAKDNTLWGFYAIEAGNLFPPHVAYCCAHGNNDGQFSLPTALPEQDSIEEDPLFEDVVNDDFRLKLNSPCLKTGMKTLGKVE